MLVIVAPGQGAQTPGFLTPWLEDPTFAARFDWLATVAGLDLAHYGTQADAETIRDTRIAGLSTREAAQKHDMSESAVKVAVHRGLKALGARFGGSGAD